MYYILFITAFASSLLASTIHVPSDYLTIQEAINNSSNGKTWSENNIYGCTDELAINYNEDANWDDGSCEYLDNGDFGLSFDGVDNWVEISNDESLSNYDEITISAWIKLEEFLNDRYMIIEKHSDSNGNTIPSGWWLAINDDSDYEYEKQKVQFVVRDQFNNQSVGYSTIVMPLGEYTHIVASYSYEDGIQIYINGENYTDLDHSFNFIEAPTMISSNSTSISIGKCRWCNTAFTEKEISQIKIWSNQLNDIDVLSEYNNLNNIDPAAFYNFNSGFGDVLFDRSGNQNHGNIYGATWVENIFGCTDELALNYNEDANWNDDSCEYSENGDYSLSFDGVDDFVNCGNSSSLNVQDSFTVQVMVNINSIGWWNGIVSKNTSTNQGWYIGTADGTYDNTPENITFGGYKGEYFGAKSDFGYNQWDKYTAVFTNGSQKLYKNGFIIDIDSMNFNIDFDNLNENLLIGYKNGDSYFDGKIDNIKIYGQIFSDEEIFNDSMESNLLAHYKFNAGEGNILFDHSGNQNHGTIYGATWFENIYGCTDELAINYNENANWDDGNCQYPDNGDYSLKFDGVDDYVQVNDFNLNEDFSMIFKLSMSSLIDEQELISQWENNDTKSWRLYIKDSHLKWEGYDTAHSEQIFNIDSYINNNQLNNIILGISKKDDNWSLIVDSEFISTNIESGSLFNSNDIITIGKRNLGSSNYLQGNINEFLVSNSSFDHYDFYDNLIVHYEFTNGYGDILFDHSGNQNHGSIYGATWVENIYGCTDVLAINYNENANWNDGDCQYLDNGDFNLSFDGIDDKVISESSIFNLGDDLTISIKFKTSNSLDTYQNIFNTGPEIYHTGITIGYNWNGNQQLAFCVGNGNYYGWYGNPCLVYNDDQENLENNKWYHILFKKEGSNYSLYFNNELNASIDIEESINYNYLVGFELGDVSHPSPEYFNGNLDEFYLWDKALNSDQIDLIFNDQIYSNDQNLLVNYSFNEGENDIVYDRSGNQNHGTIIGATWVENIYGCLDALAINYDEQADFDDGSCLYNVGDVNYDGDVNIQDIIIMIDYIVEEYPITDYAVFDVIPDGDVNILDVVNLIYIIIEG